MAMALVLVACGGDGGDDEAGRGELELPRVDLIAPAVEAVVAARGADVELLEVAANLERVDVIVRDGEAPNAVLYRYGDDARLQGPIEPRPDDRATFGAAEVTVDPARIFDELVAELPGAAVLDLAVHEDGGLVVNDATVASENGGVLLVLLQPDGGIVGMQEI
jgi:hypothetical protein